MSLSSLASSSLLALSGKLSAYLSDPTPDHALALVLLDRTPSEAPTESVLRVSGLGRVLARVARVPGPVGSRASSILSAWKEGGKGNREERAEKEKQKEQKKGDRREKRDQAQVRGKHVG